MLGTIITILCVVLGIAISIGLHELGHFIPAKLFNVPATEYFIGFGKRIFSFKRKETEYGLKAIPMGGYTRIEGMFPPKSEKRVDKWFKNIIEGAREQSASGMEPFDQSRAFYNLSFGKKLIVMMGGTLTNLVLGFICFLLAFSVIGGPQATLTVKDVVKCQSELAGESHVDDCTASDFAPAYAAGLSPGDTIVAVNGQNVSAFSDVQSQIGASNGESINLDVRHKVDFAMSGDNSNGETAELDSYITTLTLQPLEVNGTYKVGISPTTETAHMSVLDSGRITLDTAWMTAKAIVSIPSGMVDAVHALVTNQERQEKNLVSIVGIGQVAVASEKAAYTFAMKVASLLSILGSLNIALFVLNLIPLLPLDGGHSVNAVYEGLKRGVARLRRKKRPSPADLARSMPVAYFVYGLLILMYVVMILVDIFHPIV